MKDHEILDLKHIGNEDIGFLVPIDEFNIPFDIKRIFYIYDVPQYVSRGSHAYYNTEQILVCLSGSLKVKCFDGEEERIYVLDSPIKSLYVSANIWRETIDHSNNAVLLVISSQEYNEDDYIKNYTEFLNLLKRR